MWWTVALNNMYSPWQRAGTMLTFFMTCLVFFTIPLVAATSLLLTSKVPPPVSLEINHLKLSRGIEDPFMNRLTDMAEFNLSLEADFTSLFHWNTKQLFLYISAEYETDKTPKNQIVIWDRIIRATDASKKISISRLRNKYAANDYFDLLQYHRRTHAIIYM